MVLGLGSPAHDPVVPILRTSGRDQLSRTVRRSTGKLERVAWSRMERMAG